MATNDVILIRRNGSGVWTETILSSTADYVLGFDGSGNVVAKPLPSLSAHQSTHRAGGSDPLPWGSLIHGSGLIADRPAAGASNAGYYYFATDSDGGTLFRSDGSTWTAQTIGKGKTAVLDATQAFTGTNTFGNVIFDGDIQALAGGDARGTKAVDLQRQRSSSSMVASGDYSFLGGGAESTASGDYSAIVGGGGHNVSGQISGAFAGGGSTITSDYSVSLGGINNTISGIYSACIGGDLGTAHLQGQIVSGGSLGFFQTTLCVQASNTTTTATPTALFNDSTGGSALLTVPPGQTWGFVAKIVGRQAGGANHAFYMRQGIIDNTGGTTQIRGSVETIGVDIETNAAWDVAVTADNTNDALAITVTGAALTNIRWLATLELTQITYT